MSKAMAAAAAALLLPAVLPNDGTSGGCSNSSSSSSSSSSGTLAVQVGVGGSLAATSLLMQKRSVLTVEVWVSIADCGFAAPTLTTPLVQLVGGDSTASSWNSAPITRFAAVLRPQPELMGGRTAPRRHRSSNSVAPRLVLQIGEHESTACTLSFGCSSSSWHHLAITWAGQTGAWAVAQDGHMPPQGDGCAETEGFAVGETLPEVVNLTLGGGGFRGLVSGTRVWQAVRTPAEISYDAKRSTVGATAVSTPGSLVAEWAFSAASGAVVHDTTGHGYDLVMRGQVQWLLHDHLPPIERNWTKPSKVKRMVMMVSDISREQALSDNSILSGFAMAGFTDYTLEVAARMLPIANGSRTINQSYSDYALTCPMVNDTTQECEIQAHPELCDAGKCGWAKLWHSVGVTIMPQVYFFDQSPKVLPDKLGQTDWSDYNQRPYRCPNDTFDTIQHTCSSIDASFVPEGFSWFNDQYWDEVTSTWTAIATEACNLGSRAVTIDSEGYFGYLVCPDEATEQRLLANHTDWWIFNCSQYRTADSRFNGHPGLIGAWSFLPKSTLTHWDRITTAGERGRQISRAAADACPGITISVYLGAQDLAASAFMAGLGTPEVGATPAGREYNISKVLLWADAYYQDRTLPIDGDLMNANGVVFWDETFANAEHYGLTASQVETVLRPRSGIVGWGTVFWERHHQEYCCASWNSSLIVPDAMALFRPLEGATGRILNWDIAPEFAELEAPLMQQLVDIAAVYPATREYGCVSENQRCMRPMDLPFPTRMIPNQTAFNGWPNNKLPCAPPTGDDTPSCFADINRYFSNATLRARMRGIADAVSSWRDTSVAAYHKQDVLSPSFRTAMPTPAVDTANQRWDMTEVEIPVWSEAWNRRLLVGDGGESQIVLESVPGAAAGQALTLHTPNTFHDILLESTPCAGNATGPGETGCQMRHDVYVEVLLQVDRANNIGAVNWEGHDIPLNSHVMQTDGWHWVRIGRQYTLSATSWLELHTPSLVQHGKRTRIAAVQYTRTSASTMPARTTWAGADVQLYTKGRGWGRDAVSGDVVFDPKRAQTKELSYTSAQIAFPGMPATPPQPSYYYEMCVLVEPLDHEGALVDVFVPGYASKYAAEYEKQLPLPRSYTLGGGAITERGFYHLDGGFVCSEALNPARNQWKITAIPAAGSGLFALRNFTFVVRSGSGGAPEVPCPSLDQ